MRRDSAARTSRRRWLALHRIVRSGIGLRSQNGCSKTKKLVEIWLLKLKPSERQTRLSNLMTTSCKKPCKIVCSLMKKASEKRLLSFRQAVVAWRLIVLLQSADYFPR